MTAINPVTPVVPFAGVSITPKGGPAGAGVAGGGVGGGVAPGAVDPVAALSAPKSTPRSLPSVPALRDRLEATRR